MKISDKQQEILINLVYDCCHPVHGITGWLNTEIPSVDKRTLRCLEDKGLLIEIGKCDTFIWQPNSKGIELVKSWMRIYD